MDLKSTRDEEKVKGLDICSRRTEKEVRGG